MSKLSHIPAPSRQFNSAKSIPSRHYTMIAPDESHVLTPAGQSHHTKTVTFNCSHDKHDPACGFPRGREIQRAWEEKQSSLPVESRVCVDGGNGGKIEREPAEGSASLSQSPRMTVTSCRKHSYTQPHSQPLSSKQETQKSFSLPKLVQDNDSESGRGLKRKMTPSFPRNGYHITDPHALAVVSSLEEALQLMEARQQKAQREHERAMNDARERHKLEMSRERQRLQNQILTLSGIQYKGSTHTRVTVLEQQLADKTAQCYNLQAELQAVKVAVESVESLEKSKTTFLQAKIEALQCQVNEKEREIKDMRNKQFARSTSEKRRLQLAVQKEKQKLMNDLASTQEQNASLQHHVTTLNRELTQLQQEHRNSVPPSETTESTRELVKLSQKETERLQKSLSVEQQKCASLQDNLLRVSSELEECRKIAAERSTELEMLKQQNDSLHTNDKQESMKCTLTTERRELHTRNAMLTAKLSAGQDIQCSLEKKIKLLEDMLQNQRSTVSCMLDVETDLREKLARSESQLSELKDKYKALEHSRKTSTSTQTGKDQVSQNENEVYETRLQLEEFSKRLQSEVSTSTDLKEELNCSQQECTALREQLQLQQESTALSLSRIQQSSYRKQKKLVHQVKELRTKLKEAREMEKETKAECVRHKAQLTSMTTQLQKMKEANTSLNIQLNDKNASMVLIEEQMQELRERFKEDKTMQDSLRNELFQETQAHLECKTQLSEHKERVKAIEAERDEVKCKLTETQAIIEQQTQRNTSLQSLLSQVKQQLTALQYRMRQKEEKAQADLELLKKEHENEIIKVTSEVQELRVLHHHLQEKENMTIKTLKKARESLQTECHQLQTRLQQIDEELKDQTHKNRHLSAENTSLRSQLSSLQKKVQELTAAQKEYEDYAKRLEETTKSEIQQMLDEVSQHIQQQRDSHRYLEKLHRENESMALQQKETQIQELRKELAALWQQKRQEEVLVESLKFENQLMGVKLRGYKREAECYAATTGRERVLQTKHNCKLPPIRQLTIKRPGDSIH